MAQVADMRMLDLLRQLGQGEGIGREARNFPAVPLVVLGQWALEFEAP